MVYRKRLFTALAVVCFSITFSHPGRAATKAAVQTTVGAMQKEKAKARFMEGVERFFNEDYPGALAAFQESYNTYPKYSVLYNIAMCQKALYNYVESIANFEKFLTDGGKAINKEKQTKTKTAIAEMMRLIGKVTILDAPTGVTVMVDGEVVATTPLKGPIPLDPGKHLIQLVKEGYKPQLTMINVASGSSTTLRAALTPSDSYVKVDCRDKEAEVRIDGRVVGNCPYEGKIKPGPHQIEVSAPGKKAYSRKLETDPGATSTISVALEVPAPTSVVGTQENDKPSQAAKKQDRASPMLISGIVSLVVGAGMGAMGGVYNYKASQNYQDAQDLSEQARNATPSEYQQYRAEYEDIMNNELPVNNALMIVGYVSAGVFLTTGVVLLVVDSKQKKKLAASKVTPTLGGIAVRF